MKLSIEIHVQKALSFYKQTTQCSSGISYNDAAISLVGSLLHDIPKNFTYINKSELLDYIKTYPEPIKEHVQWIVTKSENQRMH